MSSSTDVTAASSATKRNGTRRTTSWALGVLFACGLTNCTYGQVTWGEPKANAYVSISNCDAQSWNTYTGSTGWYAFDGYEDADDTVTEGLILIMTRIGTIEKFDMAFQTYEPCSDDESKLCDRHDIDWGFVPLSGWEWNAWYDWLETHNLNNIYDFFAFCEAGVGASASRQMNLRAAEPAKTAAHPAANPLHDDAAGREMQLEAALELGKAQLQDNAGQQLQLEPAAEPDKAQSIDTAIERAQAYIGESGGVPPQSE